MFSPASANASSAEGQSIRVDAFDRARLITESFRQTPATASHGPSAKPRPLPTFAREVPIFIKAGELIVGDPSTAPDELRWYPEITADDAVVDAVSTWGFLCRMVTDAEREEIVSRQFSCAFWIGRSVADRSGQVLPKDLCQDVLQGFPSPIEAKLWEMGPVSQAYDFPLLFRQGVQGPRLETARFENCGSSTAARDEIPPAEYLEKKTNWEAMIISGKAILRFAQRRCGTRPSVLPQTRKTIPEGRRLEDIAATLDQVPARPARTFRGGGPVLLDRSK